MDNTLEKLFESKPKVRILRLFLRSPQTNFSFNEILRLTGLKRREAEKEIGKLEKLGFLKQRRIQVIVSELKESGNSKKLKMRPKNVLVYSTNPSFEFFRELRDLILRQVPESRHQLIQKIKKLGKVKLAIAAGAFINNDASRVDLLIVGDGINRKRLENMLSHWEVNTGRELTYALMSIDEFKYRLDMFDRFTRDMLEASHDKLINLLNIP